MASDLSSGCTEVIEVLDEKEEGEISLEDVSSSEEGQLNYGCTFRTAGQCPKCLSMQNCALWCATSVKSNNLRNQGKKNTVQEKENHHTKELGYMGTKHAVSTLQEKNNDLVPISSDSDMEIVGLTGSTKQIVLPPIVKTDKVRKKRKKRRAHSTVANSENVMSLPSANLPISESIILLKRNSVTVKETHLSKLYHKEQSPIHRNGRSTFTKSRVSKSPRRYRSPPTRLRSPIIHSKSPISKKSPRRLRSKRSPYRSPVRTPTRKLQRNLSSSSHTCVDMYGNVTKLLKKVRHLETIGSQLVSTNLNKNKEHGSSLKEKLSNMIKTSDNNESENNQSKVKLNAQEKTYENVDDEEDDLALLRQIALETKQRRASKSKEISKAEPERKDMSNSNNDNDYEDLELRMIALRSAVLKKHQNRVQRGLKPGKSNKSESICRNESPFTQSFLDSIPIPGEDYENSATPPHTPIPFLLNENMKTEDMELDTDVEQEKETDNLPYSLTNEISKPITMETDMLGIQSSDVTFITTNTQEINNPSFTSPKNNIERCQIVNEKTTENNAHIQNMTYYSNVKSHSYIQTNMGIQYTSTEPTEMPKMSYFTSQKYLSHASVPQEIKSLHRPFSGAQFPSNIYSCVNIVTNQESPYSPTDTPMYDSDLPQIDSLKQFSDSTNLLNNFSMDTSLSSTLNNEKCQNSIHQRCLTAITLISNHSEEMNHMVTPKCNICNNNTSIDMGCEASQCSFHSYPSLSVERDDKSSFVSSVISSQKSSPNDSMITIDDLPESDSDGSPVIPISVKLPKTIKQVSEEISHEATDIAEEPLYLQGIPDVTKDINKIPTLINRTLVPATILKTNKQLQRPLPSKKYETYIEPSFKSAEMQPVSVDMESAKLSTLFKPIKLAVIIKKSQLTPTAFNNVLTNNQTEEVLECEAQKSTEDTDNSENSKTKEVPIDKSSKALNTTNEEVLKSPIIKTFKNSNEIKVTPGKNEQRMQNDIQEMIKSTTKSIKDSEKSTISKNRKRVKRSRALKSKHKASGKAQPNNLTSEETVSINSVRNRDMDIFPLYHQLINPTKLNKSNEPGEIILKNNLQQESLRMIKEETRMEKEIQVVVDDVKKCDRIEKLSDGIKEKHSVKRKKQENSIKDKKIETNNKNITKTTTKQADNCTNMSNDSKEDAKSTEKESVELAESDKTLLSPHNKDEKRTDIPIISNTTNDKKTYMSFQANNVVSNLTQSDSNKNLNLTKDVNVENVTNKKVEIENNRSCSLDEDEEVLRAILLASLAKRSKSYETPTSTSRATIVLSKLSDTTNSTAESMKNKIPAKGAKLSVDFVFTSSNDSASSLSSLNSNVSTNAKSNPSIVRITNPKIAREITFSNQCSHSSLPSSTPLRKRSSLIAPKGPPKKIMKKAPILASTKVVNNAKKYQNTLIQKKLNVQKGAMIYSTQKLAENTTVYKKFNENKQSKLQNSSLLETQRFIINLGSDSESESEFEQQKNNVALISNTSNVEKRPLLAIPTSDFEKSVDQFLKEVRKKQESAATTQPSVVTDTTRTRSATSANTKPTSGNTKLSTLHATPLAVRHLPASQQEEYRRLKQQILEHERLKLQRALESSTLLLSASGKSHGTPPGPLSPASPIVSPLTLRQSENTKHNSNYMSLTVKDSGVNNVSVPLNDANTPSSFIRTSVSNIPQKIIPTFSKTNIPTKPIANINIQIPNKMSSLISNTIAIDRIENLNIPINKSQTTSSNDMSVSEDSTTNKSIPSLTVLTKDQLNLKYVQIQLKRGETGRTVILSDTTNSDKKTGNRQIDKLSSEISIDKKNKTTCVSNKLKNEIVDLTSSLEKEVSDEGVNNVDDSTNDNMVVDSETSTLILSREENSIGSSEVIDSSASTVILSQSQTKISDILALPVLDGDNSSFSLPKSTIIRKDRERNKDMWDKIKDNVKVELDVLAVLPVTEQARYLTETEQKLVTKRYMVLDDLTEMSGNLRQWEMERDIQTNLVAEVKKLREQLKLAENRLQVQRRRINSIGPKVTTAHEKINDGRRECFKLTRICSELGSRVIGEHYKLPTPGAQLLNNRLKKVAVRTRQLSKKKVPSVEMSTSADFDISSVTCNVRTLTSSSPKTSPCAFIEINNFEKNLMSHNEKERQASKTEKDPPSERNNKTGEDIQLDKTILLAESNKITDTSSMLNIEQSTHKQYEGNVSLIESRLTSTLNNSNENSDVPQNQELSRPSTSFRSNYCAMEIKQQITSEHQTKKNLEPYESILTHLKASRNTNPNGILCPYELMGTCRDGDCQFIHHSGNQDFINYHYYQNSS